MANKIDNLRDRLFDALSALKDKDKPMDLDRARAIADVAKVIVDSAKVEVDYLKVTGAVRGTGFLPEIDPAARRVAPARVGPSAVPSLPAGPRCVLCDCLLTTAYLIERGLCGSCSDRPEAQQHLKTAGSARR